MPTPAIPAVVQPTWFGDFLEQILTKAASFLATPATRENVSHGPPSWDCGDQLTVHVDKIRPSGPLTLTQRTPRGSKEVVTVADVVVTLLRCVTGVAENAHWATNPSIIPDPTVLDSEARALANEARALWFGLLGEAIAGTLFKDLFDVSFLFRDCVPIGPNGGLAGWKLTMEVALA